MAQYKFDYANATDVDALTHEVALTLDEVKAFIDQLLNSFDIEACPVENLNIIANILGFPIDREDDPDFVRRSLRNAIALYKAKGTADSIKVLFYNLGFYVDVVPLWTPDFVEKVRIFPPYIKATIAKIPDNGNPYRPGYVDVTVVNPDEQFDTSVGAFQYIDKV
jgi:phage tail P2-like protein